MNIINRSAAGRFAAAAVIAVGAAVAAVLLGTALYGSDRHSTRAFRVLRWLSGRPEPRQPRGS
ncbi:hypothetical protein [Nocardiopsis sp. NPDC057823]|uniref:hypothetical protein n=1 Tax=Nocardiopsis sp. NPDC057823 TaxID=3346256 RepID=UPI00366FA359